MSSSPVRPPAMAGFLLLAAIALAVRPVSSASAAEDLLIDDFTDPASASATQRWWGGTVQTYEHDPSQDADGNAGSGALKVTAQFDLAALAGENQFAARRELPGGAVDGSKYATLEFDIKYDAASPPQGTSGTYGYLEVGIGHTDWTQFYFGAVQTPVGQNDWQHISLPVDANDPKLNQLRDFHFKQWAGGATDGLTGTTIFWIDNVRLTAIPDTEPPAAPPSLSLEPAQAGLNVFSSGPGQYDRQTIRTAVPAASWVGAEGPVTYSLTIAGYPPSSGYQTVLYLSPGASLDAGMSYPDWAQPVCAAALINNNADGTASMRFTYKNDVANSNGYAGHEYWTNDTGTLYDGVTGPGAAGTGMGGTVAFVNSATVLGTWKVTFTSATEVTLTAPDGQTASGMLPSPETAALFSNPCYAWFGTVPQSTTNIGLGAVFSHVGISGTATPLDEDFSAVPFDSAILERSAAHPAGILQVPPGEAAWWLRWTLPAPGWRPQQSASMGADPLLPWADIDINDILTSGGQVRKLVPAGTLADPVRNFFRLVKPEAP